MVSLANQIAGRAVASPQQKCQANAAARVSRLTRVLVRSQSTQQQERTQATQFTAAAPKTQAPAPTPRPVEEREQGPAPSVRINVIAKSRWANGIPPVMGAHLMASGTVQIGRLRRVASLQCEADCEADLVVL